MDKEEMGNGKISSLLLQLCIPAIIGMLVNAIYNIVDRMFIGNTTDLGSVGLAAITICYPVTLILIALGLMAGVGGSTCFSISLGAKRESDAKHYQGNALSLAILFGLVSMIIGQLFLDDILRLLGASETVLPYAHTYLSIILFGAIFQCIALCGNNLSRAQGNAKNSMISQMLGALFNIVFDYILIIRCHMGMQGAALATIGGQLLSSLWQLAFLFSQRTLIQCGLADLKLSLHCSYEIIKTGLPAFLLQLSSSLLNIIMNGTLSLYGGDIAISTVGIITSVQTLMQMPLTGITHGQQPLISFNYGAKKYDRVKEVLKYTIMAASIYALAGWIVIEGFSPVIISLFNKDVEIMALGKNALRIWFLFLPLLGGQMMCANFFQAIGLVRYSSFLNLLRQCLLLIPLIFLFSSLFGLYGAFIAVPVADVLAFTITIMIFNRHIKSLV